MTSKNGFTLMELLIAAAILGTLAIFATQAFRQSASDIRVEDAKVRAGALAVAAQRFQLDYPSATFSAEDLSEQTVNVRDTAVVDNCGDSAAVTLNKLVQCGYLDYRQFAAERVNGGLVQNFSFYFNTDETDVRVCFTGKTGRIIGNTEYCTDGTTVTESTPAGS